MKIDWKKKLSSRKLWAAVVGIVAGLAMVFGLDENTISIAAGAVVSVASVVAYIVAEGKVDAAGVSNKAIEEVLNAVKEAAKPEPSPIFGFAMERGGEAPMVTAAMDSSGVWAEGGGNDSNG